MTPMAPPPPPGPPGPTPITPHSAASIPSPTPPSATATSAVARDALDHLSTAFVLYEEQSIARVYNWGSHRPAPLILEKTELIQRALDTIIAAVMQSPDGTQLREIAERLGIHVNDSGTPSLTGGPTALREFIQFIRLRSDGTLRFSPTPGLQRLARGGGALPSFNLDLSAIDLPPGAQQQLQLLLQALHGSSSPIALPAANARDFVQRIFFTEGPPAPLVAPATAAPHAPSPELAVAPASPTGAFDMMRQMREQNQQVLDTLNHMQSTLADERMRMQELQAEERRHNLDQHTRQLTELATRCEAMQRELLRAQETAASRDRAAETERLAHQSTALRSSVQETLQPLLAELGHQRTENSAEQARLVSTFSQTAAAADRRFEELTAQLARLHDQHAATLGRLTRLAEHPAPAAVAPAPPQPDMSAAVRDAAESLRNATTEALRTQGEQMRQVVLELSNRMQGTLRNLAEQGTQQAATTQEALQAQTREMQELLRRMAEEASSARAHNLTTLQAALRSNQETFQQTLATLTNELSQQRGAAANAHREQLVALQTALTAAQRPIEALAETVTRLTRQHGELLTQLSSQAAATPPEAAAPSPPDITPILQSFRDLAESLQATTTAFIDQTGRQVTEVVEALTERTATLLTQLGEQSHRTAAAAESASTAARLAGELSAADRTALADLTQQLTALIAQLQAQSSAAREPSPIHPQLSAQLSSLLDLVATLSGATARIPDALGRIEAALRERDTARVDELQRELSTTRAQLQADSTERQQTAERVETLTQQLSEAERARLQANTERDAAQEAGRTAEAAQAVAAQAQNTAEAQRDAANATKDAATADADQLRSQLQSQGERLAAAQATSEEAAARNQALANEMDQLRSALTSAQASQAAMQEGRDQAHARAESLQQTLSDLQERFAQTTNSLTTTQGELSTARSQIQTAENAHAELRRQHTAQVEELAALRAEQTAKDAQHARELEELRSQLVSAAAARDEASSARNELQTRFDAFRQERDQLAATLRSQVDPLQRDLAQRTHEIDNLKTSLKHARSQASAQDQRILELNAAAQKAENDLRSARTTESQQQGTIRELEQQLRALQDSKKKAATLEQQLSRAQTDLGKSKRAEEAALTKQRELQKTVNEQADSLQGLHRELGGLEDTNKALRGSLDAQDKQLREQAETLRQQDSQLITHQDTIDRQTAELAANSSSLKSLQEELQQASSAREAASSELSALRESLRLQQSDAQAAAVTAAQTIGDLTQQLSSAQEALAAAQQAQSSATSERDQLKAQADSLQKELGTLRQTVQQSAATLEAEQRARAEADVRAAAAENTLQSARAAWSTERGALLLKTGQLRTKQTNTEARLQELSTTLELSKAEFEVQRAKNETLQLQALRQETEIANQKGLLTRAQKDVQDLSKERDRLGQSLEEQGHSIDALRQIAHESTQTQQTQKAALQKAEEENSGLRAQLRTAHEQEHEAQARLRALQDQVSTLQTSHDRLKNQAAQLREALSKLETSAAQAGSEHAAQQHALREEFSNVQQQLTAAQASLSQNTDEFNQLQQKVASDAQALLEVTQQAQGLQQTLEEQQAVNRAQAETIEQQQSQLSDAAQIRDQNQTLSARLQEVEKTKDELSTQLRSLTEEKKTADREVAAARSTHQTDEAANAGLRKQVRDLTENRDALVKQVNETNKEVIARRAAAAQYHETLEQQTAALKQRTAELSAATAQLAALSTKWTTQREELEEAQMRASAAEDLTRTLQRQVEQAKMETAKIRTGLSDLQAAKGEGERLTQAQIQELTAQHESDAAAMMRQQEDLALIRSTTLPQKEEELTAARKAQRTAETARDQLQKTNENLTKQLHTAQEHVTTTTKSLEAAQKAKQAQTARADGLQQQLTSLEHTNNARSAALEAKLEQEAHLKEELAHLRTRESELTKEVEALHEALQEALEEQDHYLSQIEVAQRELTQSKADLASQRAATEASEKARTDLEQVQDDVKKRIDNELGGLQQQLIQTRSELEQSMETNQNLLIQWDELQKEHENLRSANQQLSEEKLGLNHRVEADQERLISLRKTIDSLQQEVQESETTISSTAAEAGAKNKRIAELEQQLSEAQERAEELDGQLYVYRQELEEALMTDTTEELADTLAHDLLTGVSEESLAALRAAHRKVEELRDEPTQDLLAEFDAAVAQKRIAIPRDLSNVAESKELYNALTAAAVHLPTPKTADECDEYETLDLLEEIAEQPAARQVAIASLAEYLPAGTLAAFSNNPQPSDETSDDFRKWALDATSHLWDALVSQYIPSARAIARLSQVRDDLERKLEEATHTIARLDAEVNETAALHLRYTEILKEHQEDAVRSRAERTEALAHADQVQSMLSQKELEVADLQRQLVQMEEQLDQARADAAASKEEASGYSDALDIVRGKLKKAKAEVLDLKDAQKNRLLELESKTAEALYLSTQLGNARQEVDALRHALKVAEAELDRLHTQDLSAPSTARSRARKPATIEPYDGTIDVAALRQDPHFLKALQAAWKAAGLTHEEFDRNFPNEGSSSVPDDILMDVLSRIQQKLGDQGEQEDQVVEALAKALIPEAQRRHLLISENSLPWLRPTDGDLYDKERDVSPDAWQNAVGRLAFDTLNQWADEKRSAIEQNQQVRRQQDLGIPSEQANATALKKFAEDQENLAKLKVSEIESYNAGLRQLLEVYRNDRRFIQGVSNALSGAFKERYLTPKAGKKDPEHRTIPATKDPNATTKLHSERDAEIRVATDMVRKLQGIVDSSSPHLDDNMLREVITLLKERVTPIMTHGTGEISQHLEEILCKEFIQHAFVVASRMVRKNFQFANSAIGHNAWDSMRLWLKEHPNPPSGVIGHGEHDRLQEPVQPPHIPLPAATGLPQPAATDIQKKQHQRSGSTTSTRSQASEKEKPRQRSGSTTSTRSQAPGSRQSTTE